MSKSNWKKKFKDTKYVLKIAKDNGAQVVRGKGDHIIVVNKETGEHQSFPDVKEQSIGLWGNIATTFSGWWYPFIVLSLILILIATHQ